MVLVTGGSSSGKSAFAEETLLLLGGGRRIYAATMIPWDDECRARIANHRAMRAEKSFETAECPVDLENLEVPGNSEVLLECMSNLAANELYRQDGNRKEDPAEEIFRAVERLNRLAENLVVVTNEVFSDGETHTEETEAYLEILGRLNVRLAALADRVVEVVCGIPLTIKG